MYLPDFGCNQIEMDDMCDFLDEIIASGDDDDDDLGAELEPDPAPGALFVTFDDVDADPDEDGQVGIFDECAGLVRDALHRLGGEPSGEMLEAYDAGELSDQMNEDMRLILSLREDLRIEIEVRREMKGVKQ